MKHFKNIWFAFAIGLAASGALYIFSPGTIKRLNFFGAQTGRTYAVELRQDSFYPAELTIQKGDTVKFATIAGKPFWPASDLHPTHEIYPEFDPKEPIRPDASWSFRFDKVGFWKYHNHLSPTQRGAITVAGDGMVEPPKECAKHPDQQQCWESMVDSALYTKGVWEAFDTIRALYATYPQFAGACHGLVHKIGEQTYLFFAERKDIALPANVSYCSFGFYHGFMQELVHKRANPDEARSFCEYAAKQLRDVSSGTLGTCYHGIGHGAVDDNDGKWASEDVLVAPALNFCEKVSPTPTLLNRCSSGVFNAMAVAYNSGKLVMNKDDPLRYCRQLKKPYAKLTCYQEMNTSLIQLSGGDFKSAARFIAAVPEDSYALSAMESLSAVNGQLGIQKKDFTSVVDACHSLPSRFVTSFACVKGYVSGLLQVGPPNREYVKPLEFCGTLALSEDEHAACYKELIWQTSNIYPPDKENQICAMIDKKYNLTCSRPSQ